MWQGLSWKCFTYIMSYNPHNDPMWKCYYLCFTGQEAENEVTCLSLHRTRIQSLAEPEASD